MKTNVIFTLIVCLFLFALLEVGVRSYKYIRGPRHTEPKAASDPAAIFVPHPYAAYVGNPDHPDHNAQGFRADKTRLYDGGTNSITIACLGGSTTYGTRVSKEDSYPYLLEKRLSQSAGRTINVINGGLAGYSTANIISFLSLRIVHLKPDITIFYVGFNDAWNRINYSAFEMDYTHAQQSWEMPDFPFWRYSKLLDVLANRLGYPSPRAPHLHSIAWRRKSGNPEVNFGNSSGDAFRRNLMTLIAIARTHASIPVVVTQATDFKNHHLAEHNEVWIRAADEHTTIIRQVASDMSVHLIDIRDIMTDKGEYFADVLHMNANGNRKRAEIIAEYLMRNELVGKGNATI